MPISFSLTKLVRLVAFAAALPYIQGLVNGGDGDFPAGAVKPAELAAPVFPHSFETAPGLSIGTFSNILLSKEKLATRNITRGELEKAITKIGPAITPEMADRVRRIIVKGTVDSDIKSASEVPEGLYERQEDIDLNAVLKPAWIRWLLRDPWVSTPAALATGLPYLTALILLILAGILIPVILAEKNVFGKGPVGPKTVVSLTIGSWGGSNVTDINGHPTSVGEMNQEGSVPIWNEEGLHIGISHGNKNSHLNGGSTTMFTIPHGESEEAQMSTASYLAVYMAEGDAICVSQIRTTSDDGLSYTWLGDIGFTCGYPWYYSDMVVNSFGYQPKCTWLDSDSADKHQGMGIHLPDFVATPERVYQYHVDPRTLCSSPPRFQMYKKFTDDHGLPIYSPPLQYRDNMSDADIDNVLGGTKVLVSEGKKMPEYQIQKPLVRPLGVMFGMSPDIPLDNGTSTDTLRRRAAYKPGHDTKLISSDYDAHDIHVLCDPEQNAQGPDFVSVGQGLFCDMSMKELWPICDEEHQHECFDYEKKSMVGHHTDAQKRDAMGREIPSKQYSHEFVWRAGKDSHGIAF